MRLAALLTLLVFPLTLSAQTKDYTRHVNPFIGTGGHGHTFPGATVPFGMVQLSPDTRIDNWDGSSGYHYSDDIIYGFSHTHLSGTGIPDGCDILFMPSAIDWMSSDINADWKGLRPSKFSHKNEKAEPGYYSVLLDEGNILAEMTSTNRVGLHRYTFPNSNKAPVILFNLKWRDSVQDSMLRIVGGNRIEGYRRSSSWAKNQLVYFVAEFSEPLHTYLIFTDGFELRIDPGQHTKGKEILAAFNFSRKSKKDVLVKVGISHVSIEGARKNLKAELPHWDFDKVRADAKAAWNKELSKIEVSGGTPEQTTNFYTALYHTMINPNVFNDVDGRYKGHDGKIHQLQWNADAPNRNADALVRNRNADAPVRNEHEVRRTGDAAGAGGRGRPRSEHYTVFSLWDTFRAAHPLYTIIDQKRTVDFINTFIRQYEQGGRLPVWELWGEETDTMIGYHAVSVIADAMAKGIKGFDYEKAYEAAKHSAELDHHGLAAYKKRGYISMEDDNESVSKTLEYAYNDWCIAQMARIIFQQRVDRHNIDPTTLRYSNEDALFSARARYFENLFDPETGFFRPKQNGGFVQPFAPNEVTFHFTEGNSWQYSFFVPHDIPKLMSLMGGADKFAAKLDELFTTDQKLIGRQQPDITGLIGQYAHGNEPSHHIPYLFNAADQPWKTQKYVRKIMDEFYKNSPDGLIGNEDCGQMSAWYVLSSLGFYQVAPGSPYYDIGTPLFRSAKINLESGKTFTILAPKVSAKNFYVKKAYLNGEEIYPPFFRHEQLMSGGTMRFEMSDDPKAVGFFHFPHYRLTKLYPVVPIIDGERVFRDSTKVTLKSVHPEHKIHYTVDGSEPDARSHQYAAPFPITSTMIVKAVTVDAKGEKSIAAEAKFHRRPNDWTVQLLSKYNRQYTGGGDEGLIDGIRGTTNFASGEWQGYQGQDFVAVIDLQKPSPISKVGGSFLQVARSWIWMPKLVEFEISNDGENFTKIAEIKADVAPENMEHIISEYSQTVAPVTARYIRVKAHNLGKIPAWHPGAGFDAFIFVDEIFVE